MRVSKGLIVFICKMWMVINYMDVQVANYVLLYETSEQSKIKVIVMDEVRAKGASYSSISLVRRNMRVEHEESKH